MTMNLSGVAVLGLAAMLWPAAGTAQTDPGAMPSQYPQSPQGMNQQTNQQGASTPQTGAQSSTPTSMRDSLGAPGLAGQEMIDKQFVRSAEQGSLAEVKLATLATQKGGPDVKDCAQKLLDDHTAMDKDLGTVADSMGVMLPKKLDKESQAEYDKLNGLSGKDFDTEYLTYTVRQHWATVHSFYMESSVAADPELQSEVVKALMTMRQHIGLISKTATAEGITLPPRPPRPTPTTASK
jgi:putative membrane protein